MKIKKYIVRQMQEAMRLIREDLGPDAVIISSYPLLRRNFWEIFSPRQLEVTAAVDDTGITKAKKISLEDEQDKNIRSIPTYHFEKSNQIFFDEKLNDFHLKKKEKDVINFNSILLRKQVETEFSFIEVRRKYLLDMGVQEEILEHLLSDLENEIPDSVIERDEYLAFLLKRRIASLLEPFYRKEKDALICFFIGPTGVGKTTTMAKLAVKLSLFERKEVALIVLTNSRFHIEEELEACTKMNGVSLETVMTSPELTAAVHRRMSKDIILVDTEGIPSKNTSRLLGLKDTLDAVEQVKEVFLVLSATTKNSDLYRIVTDYNRVGFSKVIFTKLDETETYGSLLNVACYSEKPISYVTYGQNIPDDIWLANPRNVASLLLRRYLARQS